MPNSNIEQSIKANIDIEQIRKRYFDKPSQQIRFKKGETILQQSQENDKLFLILEGHVVGYVQGEEEKPMELFRLWPGRFVGVYSFFTGKFQSFAHIRAEENCSLAYITLQEAAQLKVAQPEVYEDFIKIIVSELAYRNYLAHKIATEKERALKKLLQTDKMATLGQMAAGIAHELNNSMVVIQRKTEWLAEEIGKLVKAVRPEWNDFFVQGLEKGQFLSSSEVRQRGKFLQEKFHLFPALAKRLAKAGLDDQVLQSYKSDLPKAAEQMVNYWELGLALYDMSFAATQATHVVKSVKQLGANRSERVQGVDLNETINESNALLRSLLRKVSLELKLAALPGIYANNGELVQIWTNLIKNACESMLQANTPDPLLLIKTSVKKEKVEVQITDNGPGIPESILPKIFQPNVTTKVQGLNFGLGLGLSIVQRLVSSYEGSIHVQTKPGKTTFTVILPVA
ncbi:ATP-binding protein [Rapidithrix thailandica]|uniref:histidine kinase n=1 Tax=Rapidithrix thailandica TaxID=413964 RepID=A0AAW9S9U7_9BACT